jgi:hypothetical protein
VTCGGRFFARTETRDWAGVLHLDVECSHGHTASLRHSKVLREPEPVG